jgi:hypothetical protein
MTFVYLVINPIFCILNARSFCILEAKKYLWRVLKKLDAVSAASLPANASVQFPLSAHLIVKSG